MAEQGDELEHELTLIDTLRVVSRHGSTDRDAEDQAAALTVLSEFLVEEAEARHDADNAADHWSQSARALRTRITPGVGAWRGFTG